MLALKKCSEHDVLVKTGGYFQGIYFFSERRRPKVCFAASHRQANQPCAVFYPCPAAVALKNPFVVPKVSPTSFRALHLHFKNLLTTFYQERRVTITI